MSTLRRNSKSSDSGSRRGNLSSQDEVSQHSTAFAKLMALGKRFGIENIIMKHTSGTLKQGEVFSIRGNETDRETGLTAYACSKAKRSGTLADLAQDITDEAIDSLTGQLVTFEDAVRQRHCLVPGMSRQPAGLTPEEIKENLTDAKAELLGALDALADLYVSAGEQALGVVVREDFLGALGLPENARIYVINSDSPEVRFDLMGSIRRDTAAEEGLTKEVGDIMSAVLKIQSDVSSRHPAERPLVRFEVHVSGHAGMKEAGPAAMFIVPGETREQAMERATSTRTSTADIKHVKPEMITAGLDKRKVYYVGRDPSDECFGLQSFLPHATKPWLAEKQLALVFREDALIVVDIGEKKMKMPQQ